MSRMNREEMSDAMRKFVELVEQAKEAKQVFIDLAEVSEQLEQEIGIDGHFQDEETGQVFQLEKPKGRFVEYVDVGYKRSRGIDDPKVGGNFLAKKTIKELGYDA